MAALAFASPLTRYGVPVPLGSSFTGPRLLMPLDPGVPLRIMPLGASITYGWQSSTGDGYRGPLRNMLTAAGSTVNMVGSREHGTMVDNDVEGWPGFVIDQVAAKANLSVPTWRPNVVLVNAGTNDCLQNRDVAHGGERMERLVRSLWRMSPRALVVLSSLIVNSNPAAEQNVLAMNSQFRDLAGKLRAEGLPIVFADMHSEVGPVKEDLKDGTHPDDAGYQKLANIWYAAMVEAENKRMYKAPEPIKCLPDDGGS